MLFKTNLPGNPVVSVLLKCRVMLMGQKAIEELDGTQFEGKNT